jgi:hypothetical protein
VFTARYQATRVPSRDRCIATVLHRTILKNHDEKTPINAWYCVKVKVALRLTVSQSVNLGVEPHLGLMTRYLLLFDSYGFDFDGRHLSEERMGLFFFICY